MHKAIIASLVLVLGASSVVMADPGITVSAKVQVPHGTVVVRDRDQRVPPPPVAQPFHDRFWWSRSRQPVTLASSVRFPSGGRTFITVADQGRRFRSLQISPAGGRTFVQQVYVEFDSGQEQVVRNVDRMLSGGQILTVDLDGDRRIVRRVIVYGNNTYTGHRHGAGGFTLTAM
jgi:hypothetical protein